MLQEYLNRTYFVILHGFLLLFYLYKLTRSYWGLRQERNALKLFEKNWKQSSDTGETEGRRFDLLKEAVADGGPTALGVQVRALVRATNTGEEFDHQRALAQLGRALAEADDVIRFCINGLVIVGLMGTLYAFYEMWGKHGTDNLTAANSTLYLESMSTALLVSFVGLVLALITNFLFALLRASRQRYLSQVAAFLMPVAALLPTDAKTHLLLTNLLAPLSQLVEQLRLQNDQVLRGLTDAVHNRTEQLNRLIAEATGEWQAAIGAFRAETLTAVDKMQEAATRLDGSSRTVASTLQEVGKSLERTKDIGRIVDQLDITSGKVIESISSRLGTATDAWIESYGRATKDYRENLQSQAKTAETMSRELTSIIRDDLNLLVTSASSELDRLREQLSGSFTAADQRLAATLESFSEKFALTIETLGAKWMTEAAANTDQAASRMGVLVDDWKTTASSTADSIAASLAGSRELVNETTRSVNSLSNDLTTLEQLARVSSENTGSPVYMSQAVDRLGEIGESLKALAAKLEYGQALNQLRDVVVTSTRDVQALTQQVGELGKGAPQERAETQRRLHELGVRFDGLDDGMKALRTDVKNSIARNNSSQRVHPVQVALPPPNWWQRLRRRFSWRRKSKKPAGQLYERVIYKEPEDSPEKNSEPDLYRPSDGDAEGQDIAVKGKEEERTS
ncbi:MAG TPA: methyl-accepting chemotaxis protein [Pyrinomonadaceae bacterium]|nr:methyl-accepting chemotaxis protein [Pyrinomonadaceae bacterium]